MIHRVTFILAMRTGYGPDKDSTPSNSGLTGDPNFADGYFSYLLENLKWRSSTSEGTKVVNKIISMQIYGGVGNLGENHRVAKRIALDPLYYYIKLNVLCILIEADW